MSLNKKALIFLFAVALAVRLANLAILWESPEHFFTEDSRIYWSLAANFRATGQFGVTDAQGWHPETERVPLYAFALAAIQAMFGDAPHAVIAFQAVTDSVTVILIALIGAMLATEVGVLAGALAAVWPNMVINSALILTDSLFLTFLTASLLACARFLFRPGVAPAALVGLFLGLGLATRAIVQFLVPLFLLVLLVGGWRAQLSGRQLAGAGLAFLVLAVLPVAPLVYRNATAFGEVFITDQGSAHLFGWVVPLAQSYESGQSFDEAFQDLRRKFHAELTARRIEVDALPAHKLKQLRQQFAMRQLVELPLEVSVGAWLRGATINLAAPAVLVDERVRAMRSDSFLQARGTVAERAWAWFLAGSPLWQATAITGLLGSILVSGFALVGLVTLSRRSGWIALLAVGFVLYFLLLMGPVGAPKYRLPFAPVTIVLTALALIDIRSWVAARRQRYNETKGWTNG